MKMSNFEKFKRNILIAYFLLLLIFIMIGVIFLTIKNYTFNINDFLFFIMLHLIGIIYVAKI